MNTSWLAQLAPEHAPSPPGWWPPAPGWWLLAALSIGAAAGAFLWWRNPRRKLRSAAMQALARIDATGPDAVAAAREIQNLLRRYALAVFGPERVARLSGEEWLRFLAARGAAPFGGPIGRSLLSASYGAKLTEAELADQSAWCAAARTFLRRAGRRGQDS
jgi:hypothetical protein